MSLTVTATASGAGSANGIELALQVFTGASLTQNGATAASETVTLPELAITPHVSGSVVVGVVGCGSSGTAFSSPAGSITSVVNSTVVTGSRWGVYRSGSTTTSPTTYGWAAPTAASGNIYIAQAEILASGTLALDGSTPAVVSTAAAKTIATASFTPPAGAVLVAAVATSWSGSGAVSIALSDSSGAYTWSQLAGTGTTDLASIWVGVPLSVSGSGSASMASMGATGSGLVADPVSGTGAASLASMRATGIGVVANPVTGSGSASLASMGTAGSGAVAPAPPYPDGDLGARVELLLGGAWTDLTTAALPDGQQSGSIKSGQAAGAQQPSPAALNGTWDNPDYSLSPRNASGPYFGQLRQNTPARVSFNSPYGAYLRMEAGASDRAYVNDTATLHVTGSLELRIGARVSDWRGCVLAARIDNSIPSWYWLLGNDGTLAFWWYDSAGTAHSVQSPAAAAVSWKAFRVTLDTSGGDVEFFVSDSVDGAWTSMGAAASGTSGSATSVRAGNAPLVVGWSGNLTVPQLLGQVYDFRMYSGIGGTVIADAAFGDQAEGAATWTDGPGLAWNLAGGAELTARDYRLYGEVASLAPSADVSSSLPKTAAQLAGRLRRLQQGYAPTVESPMRRAVLTQAGSLYPVGYWTMEDGVVAASFGPAAGTQLMSVSPAVVRPASDSSFEASAPLPQLNGATLVATVDSYTGATAWAVRFLCKIGQLPATGTTEVLASVALASGTIRRVDVVVDDGGSIGLAGYNSGGSSVFTTTRFAFGLTDPKWVSVEGTVSGSNTIFNFITLVPGASSGSQLGGTLPSTSGSPANVSSVTVNSDAFFTDTVVGHLSVQRSWASLFALGDPLNAWRTELAANRFARVCDEQGIACRILGRPSVTQAMGAQPRGSAWTILRDCVQTEQGLIFEPADVFGVAFRTRESMGSQAPGLTLDFAKSDLPGDLKPLDNDDGLLNDVTASMTDGTTWRAVLNDGSARSVSEPEDGGAGTYAGSPPFTFNLADANQLQAATELYLAIHSVDEARYSNMAADFGIPGTPAADIARLRPGDLVVVKMQPASNVILDTAGDPILDTAGDPVADTSAPVPGPDRVYQSTDIRQLVTGATEAFGPGRKITWDAVPASPYS